MHCENDYVCRCSFFLFLFSSLLFVPLFFAAFSADAFKQTSAHTLKQKAACNYANAAVCDTFSLFGPHRTKLISQLAPNKIGHRTRRINKQHTQFQYCETKTASVSERVKN